MRGRSLALIWLRPAPIHLMGAKSTLRGRPIKTMRRWPPGLDALAAFGQRSTMMSKRKNPRMSGGFVTAGVPGLEPRTNDSNLGCATPPQLGRNSADFRGSHGVKCTRWHGLIRAHSGHAAGYLVRFWSQNRAHLHITCSRRRVVQTRCSRQRNRTPPTGTNLTGMNLKSTLLELS